MKNKEILEIKRNSDADGYVLLPGFLDQKEVDVINTKIDQFIRERVSDLPSKHVFYEDAGNPETLKQLQDLNTYDPFFAEMLFNSKFKNIAEILLDDNVIGKILNI